MDIQEQGTLKNGFANLPRYHRWTERLSRRIAQPNRGCFGSVDGTAVNEVGDEISLSAYGTINGSAFCITVVSRRQSAAERVIESLLGGFFKVRYNK